MKLGLKEVLDIYLGTRQVNKIYIGTKLAYSAQSAYSEGLAYTLSANKTSYAVTGIGTCTDTAIKVPKTYNDGYSGTLPVTSIGDKAFYNCDSLTSVEIPDSITSIGTSAFADCDSLQYNIKGNLKYLGNAKNKYLYLAETTSTDITLAIINSNCKFISDYAFYNCASLTGIEIPNSVTSIGESAFRDCSSLTSIVIPNGVTSIGQYAFLGCSKLTSVEIGNGVTSIGSHAFADCDSLTSIEIGDGVTSIGSHAFSDCTSLTSLVIPNGVTSIGEGAFYGCTGLTNLEIPDSIASVARVAFGYCTSLRYNEKDGLKYLGNKYNKYLILKDTISEEMTTVAIDEHCKIIYNSGLADNKSLTSITIPSSVVNIGEMAFASCLHLARVDYTGTIDQWAQIEFDGRAANPLNYTKNLYINNELVTQANITTATKINDYAFLGCGNLTSVLIGDGVTSIGKYAFESCNSLTSVTIGNSVKSVGLNAFDGCRSLARVDYTGTIDQWAQIEFSCRYDSGIIEYFGNSNPLYHAKNLYIDGELVTEAKLTTVTKISNYAFYMCDSLTSVEIGGSVTSIGREAFYGCSKLTSVIIDSGVENIGYRAFMFCTSLESIIIKDNVKIMGTYAFSKCNKLTSVTIGNGTENIGASAFEDCTSLANINIPNSVTNIGDYAFQNCDSLISIEIPDSVTRIGRWAFYSCSSLKNISFSGTVAKWNTITKLSEWTYNTPVTKVICTDGEVAI
jgi:hypothetical protein